MNKTLIYLFLGALLTQGVVCAEERPSEPLPPPFGTSIGLQAIYKGTPYRGGEEQFRILPGLTLFYPPFYLFGPSAGLMAYRKGALRVAVEVNGRLEDREKDDSGYLDGLHNVKETVEGGVKLTWMFSKTNRAWFKAAHDLLGRHKGLVMRLGYDQKVPPL